MVSKNKYENKRTSAEPSLSRFISHCERRYSYDINLGLPKVSLREEEYIKTDQTASSRLRQAPTWRGKAAQGLGRTNTKVKKNTPIGCVKSEALAMLVWSIYFVNVILL